MKNLFFILVFALCLGACTSNENTTNSDSLNLENMDLKLNIGDLSQAKFPATNEGLAILLQELTTEIYGVDEVSQSLNFFESDGFYVVKRLVPNKNVSAKPCKTETIICTNADEVKAALTKIIGDGKRDVTISYDRPLLRVVISYNYQDC